MFDSISPVITLTDYQLRTNSYDVAAFFGKKHCDVMRQIRNSMANCPDLFSERNFALAENLDAQGKPRPYYTLTRDAFMLVVMGFTGYKAMQCKLAYIEEFNRMEAELAKGGLPQPEAKPAPAALPAPAFICPYASPQPDLSPLRNLFSEEEIKALEQTFEQYQITKQEFCGQIKTITRSLGRCAEKIEAIGGDRDDKIFHHLANIVDPGQERWHGFDNSMLNHIDQMISHCRHSFKFLCEIQGEHPGPQRLTLG